MPIIQTETGYVYRSSKKSKRSGGFAKRFGVFLLILAVVCGVIYLSNVVDFAGVFKINKYQIFDGQTYFAVAVKDGSSFAEVSSIAEELKGKNASGFVFKLDGTYYATANVYQNKTDAQKVCENIADEYNATVLPIKLNKLVISSNYTQQELSNIKNAIAVFEKSFDELYQTSLSLDRGEILSAEAKQKLQVFKETCQMGKETFAKVFANNCDVIVTNVKILQSEVISNIGTLLLSDNLKGDIKYCASNLLSYFLTFEANVTK